MLSDEETVYWQEVMKGVKPIAKKEAQRELSLPSLSLLKKRSRTISAALPLVTTSLTDHPAFLPPTLSSKETLQSGDMSHLDKHLAKRFRQGEMPLEMIVDLHGNTMERAFERVYQAINQAFAQRKRCILIITGKGGSFIEREKSSKGVLKESFSSWMNHTYIKPLILGFSPAQPKDGGTGAFYVLIRRNRP